MDDWSKQFENLLSSPLGKELVATLSERRSQLVADAENAEGNNQNALLNQAKGVRLAIEHLQVRAVTVKPLVMPKDEGSKNQK